MTLTYARFALCMLLVVGPSTRALAQARSEPEGGRGGSGDTKAIVVPLSVGGLVVFNPEGSFAAALPGADVSGVFNASGAGGHDPRPGSPPIPPSVSIVDIQAVEAELIFTRAAHCLTIADAAPCDAPNVPPGALNVVSTEVDLAWLVNQEVQAAWKDVPVPGIVMQANPPEGLTQMDSWFWVDRTTYEGQVYSEPVHIPAPWTLDWDTVIHHHDTSSGPCAGDPAAQCTTRHDWDETVHHHEDHLDVVDVTVTLTPARYAWDFGDDDARWRPSSHEAFANNSGLGIPFTDPYHASTVAHKYSQSSLDVFNLGGFLVRLTATWNASGHVRATRDGVVVQDVTVSLDSREGQYEQRYQVRESQPVLISADGGRP